MDTGEGPECDQSGDGPDCATALVGRLRSPGGIERAATPVVGNILLVAVVLIIAMLVTVLAVGILDGTGNESPAASFTVDRGSDGQLSLVRRLARFLRR